MIEFSRWPQSLGHAPTLSILGAATFLAGAAGLGALLWGLPSSEIASSSSVVLVAIGGALAALLGLLLAAVTSAGHSLRELARDNQRLAGEIDRAEAATRAKSDSLAHLSHELRTPLNAVLGFAEVIRDEALGPEAPKCYRDYVGDIHSAGQHLLRIVNSSLDMVSIESGKVGIELQEIDPVDDVLVPVAVMLKTQSDKAGVALNLDAPRTMTPIVTDAEKLKRTVLNLAANTLI